MKSNSFSGDLESRENRGLCALSEEVLIGELNRTLWKEMWDLNNNSNANGSIMSGQWIPVGC